MEKDPANFQGEFTFLVFKKPAASRVHGAITGISGSSVAEEAVACGQSPCLPLVLCLRVTRDRPCPASITKGGHLASKCH